MLRCWVTFKHSSDIEEYILARMYEKPPFGVHGRGRTGMKTEDESRSAWIALEVERSGRGDQESAFLRASLPEGGALQTMAGIGMEHGSINRRSRDEQTGGSKGTTSDRWRISFPSYLPLSEGFFAQEADADQDTRLTPRTLTRMSVGSSSSKWGPSQSSLRLALTVGPKQVHVFFRQLHQQNVNFLWLSVTTVTDSTDAQTEKD
ncbi:hypothetical protein EV363DRAFT_1301248 [Boletus edulis]|nr:hypothetical protein EV363DRAFT_1301248 [Boletus edulis]